MGSDTDPPDDIDIDQVADLVADRLEDKYSSKISRRAAIGGLLGVGGLGAMSSSASAQTTVGGGGAADAMSDHAAPHYRAKTSEIDETVTDRFVTVTSDDANLGYSAGDLVRTTGSDVELVSRGYEALEADKTLTGATRQDGDTSFGDWETNNEGTVKEIEINVFAETDGTTNGIISLEIDYDSGTSSDVDTTVARASASAGSGFEDRNYISFKLPPGGSYKVTNEQDPTGNNNFFIETEWIL